MSILIYGLGRSIVFPKSLFKYPSVTDLYFNFIVNIKHIFRILFLIGEIFVMVQNVVLVNVPSAYEKKIHFLLCEVHINVMYQSCLTVLLKSYKPNDFLFVSSANKTVLKSTTILMDLLLRCFSSVFWNILKHFYRCLLI